LILRSEEKSGRKPERYVHQAYENRDFNERPDDSGKRLTRSDAKDRHSDCYREFEIVARCSECQGGRISIVDPAPWNEWILANKQLKSRT